MSMLQRFKPYPAYKDSGVEWLGEIPAHWEVRRLKHIAPFAVDRISEKDMDLPFIGLEHIESGTGKLVPDAANGDGESGDTEGPGIRFKSGDVLFGKLRPYLAKVIRSEFEGRCSSELLVLRSSREIKPPFLGFQLLSTGFIGWINAMTYGTKMPRANADQVGATFVALAPIAEQDRIAAFLDRETARIGGLVAKNERLIELLREKRTALITRAVTKGFDPKVLMKDSGVEWLCEIPLHWEVMKTTWLFSIGSGTTPRSEDPAYYGGVTPWITTSELRESIVVSTEKNVSDEALRSHSSLKVYPKGSIAVAMYGATIGRIGILGVAATVNQACCVFSEPKSIEAQFWFYWLQMRRPYLISLGYGGGQPNLSQELLRSVRVPMPPLPEQCTIIAFLDRETAKIDALVTKVLEAIDSLKEYRTALISAAVTGKIDIREPAAGLASS